MTINSGRTVAWPSKPAEGVTGLDCGHTLTERPDNFTTGYGYILQPDGSKTSACYPCMDDRQRAEMADPEKKKIVAYVSSDGKTITTWPGGFLAHVTWHTTSRGGWRGSIIHIYRVRDPRTGREWYGRNAGPGTCITLTAVKGWKPREENSNA